MKNSQISNDSMPVQSGKNNHLSNREILNLVYLEIKKSKSQKPDNRGKTTADQFIWAVFTSDEIIRAFKTLGFNVAGCGEYINYLFINGKWRRITISIFYLFLDRVALVVGLDQYIAKGYNYKKILRKQFASSTHFVPSCGEVDEEYMEEISKW